MRQMILSLLLVCLLPTANGELAWAMKDSRVALLIDDTVSMRLNRERVEEIYWNTFHDYPDQLIGVWLYRNKEVERLAVGEMRFASDGNEENTFAALSLVAKENPDIIILVSDEPGENWQWDKVPNLPMVIGHCLPSPEEEGCRTTFTRLTEETHGWIVFHLW